MSFLRVAEIVSFVLAIATIFFFVSTLGEGAASPIIFMLPYSLIGVLGYLVRTRNSGIGNRTIGEGVEFSSILANLFYFFVAINVYELGDTAEGYNFLTFLILWTVAAIVCLLVSYFIGSVKEKSETISS